MDPGRLDERITIEVKVVGTQNATGGYDDDSWTEVDTVWAQVQPMSGRERVQAEQIEGPTTYRITIRRRDDLTVHHRIVWRSRPLNIRFDGYVSPREQFMTFDAEMGVTT